MARIATPCGFDSVPQPRSTVVTVVFRNGRAQGGTSTRLFTFSAASRSTATTAFPYFKLTKARRFVTSTAMGKGAPFEPCLLLSTADALPSAATVATERSSTSKRFSFELNVSTK